MIAGGESESESDRLRESRAELDVRINRNLAVQEYLRPVFTFMVYLAFTLSTVVLLGGYVSSLQRKDFACLTAITVVQATRFVN
mgnify:CR=1 FL=1